MSKLDSTNANVGGTSLRVRFLVHGNGLAEGVSAPRHEGPVEHGVDVSEPLALHIRMAYREEGVLCRLGDDGRAVA